MPKKVGVLLSGCGVFDGSEIHEATFTLLFLDRNGADAICMAPNKDQFHVINHQVSNEMNVIRNVFVESARISRGNMQDLKDVSVDQLDGLILPGGFGAAKNLINYAVKGRDCSIDSDVQKLIQNIIESGKPLGAMCIAPMVVAVALKDTNINPLLTIGNDSATASDIEYFKSRHKNARVDEIVTDKDHKIVTTPAYMIGPSIKNIAVGIEKLVTQVLDWA